MLKAELHGKASSRIERLEDALTSNVFGSLLYADAFDVFYRWLAGATNLLEEPLRLPAGKPAGTVHFWPTMRSAGRRVEPDVLLVLGPEPAERMAVVVEAKYFSGLSSEDVESDDAEEESKGLGNQLAREFDALANGTVETREGNRLDLPRRNALVYLTSDSLLPDVELKESVLECRDEVAARRRIYWTNWQGLAAQLKDSRRPATGDRGRVHVLHDLWRLLEKKRLHTITFDDAFADLGAGPSGNSCAGWCDWLDETEGRKVRGHARRRSSLK